MTSELAEQINDYLASIDAHELAIKELADARDREKDLGQSRETKRRLAGQAMSAAGLSNMAMRFRSSVIVCEDFDGISVYPFIDAVVAEAAAGMADESMQRAGGCAGLHGQRSGEAAAGGGGDKDIEE